MELTKEIKVYDNFLDIKVFLKMQQIILGQDFPWFGADVLSPEDPDSEIAVEDKHNFQFYHMFFMNPYHQSPALDVIKPLLGELQPMFLIKAKANLNPVTDKHIEHGMHVDISKNISSQSYTAVFYLNTNNGYTRFKTGEKVESVSNRLVVFPREMQHTGATCTDERARVVLNLNFIKVE